MLLSKVQRLKQLLTLNSRKTLNASLLSDLRARAEYTLLEHHVPAYPEKAPLVYEDALLRKFSVDLDFVASCTLY